MPRIESTRQEICNYQYNNNIRNIQHTSNNDFEKKIIENGIIPESYSHNVTGKNPRTIIGANKKQNIVLIVKKMFHPILKYY